MLKLAINFMQTNISSQFSIFVFLLTFNCLFLQAKDIDFNREYGHSGDLIKKIQRAIDNASSGDVLIFKSLHYNLGGGLEVITIDKPLTIRGAEPAGFNSSFLGASGIRTTLGNTVTFAFRSDNIIFKNISIVRKDDGEDVYDILIDARHTTYLEPSPETIKQKHYKGIRFENVVLNGGAYGVHSGNGIGMKMINTSLINWRRIGYWANRFGRSDRTPKGVFKSCIIAPKMDIIGFDDRAISFDAGNSEYPVVWDTNNTIIDDCKINETGVAVSRCRNFTIKNSTFNDSTGAVDLIHIEEFSNDIRVQNNIFNCSVDDPLKRTRICQLDRELQPSYNIQFRNNKIVGAYNFFISGYASKDIKVIGNDFRSGNARNENSIDFTYYESREREPIPAEILSDNIVIKRNPGLGYSQNKNFKVQIPKNNSNMSVEGYTDVQQSIIKMNSPAPAVEDGIYEIVNKANGQRLSVSNNGSTLMTTNRANTNSQWKITFNPPYSYYIQNVGNDKYLETHVGYTEFDVFTDQPQALQPFLNNVPSGDTLPFWSIVSLEGSDYFEIFPGGNERQAAYSANDDSSTRFVFTYEFDRYFRRIKLPRTDSEKWEIRPVSGNPDPDPNPNPGITNLALNKRATQSSGLYGLTASFAVDGDRDSFAHTDNDANAWIEIDLGAQFNIKEIKVWNRPDCCADRLSKYQIFTSDVPFDSKDIVTTANQPGVGVFFQEATAARPTSAGMDAGRIARYVRIQLIGTNFLHPSEIEVMGTPLDSRRYAGIDTQEKIISIYPNPILKGDLVAVQNTKEGKAISLVDFAGRTLVKKITQKGQTTIDTSDLSSGVYFVVVDKNITRLMVN
ncbi:discoidin domain-containing protein [Aquimarina sp. RZ0]|uniref:galactose-binding domain-containing protein n=1 Tax=Aquimarina sp. RZ0 TaxID=2607730 RepID=UPI0011F0ACE2|nr:discoidin domain-containing protein [Aquimarina sp. RZ0]KAA1246211.1 T9SS type A sorting domain-containing protein [Aquimarina sp. RZ0]